MAAANTTSSPPPYLYFQPNLAEWKTNTLLTSILAGVSVVLFSFLLLRPSPTRRSDGKTYDLGGIPVVTAWGFFTRRYDFIRERFGESGGRMVRFRVVQYRVIAMMGESARKAFFNQPSLSLPEGYRILMGSAPELRDIKVQATAVGDDVDLEGHFVKRLLSLVRPDRIADTLPALLADLNNRMLDWGNEGEINPFKEVNDLVFQMTVRMATCKELAEDREAVEELKENYWTLEKSTTPFALLFPWFPGSAKKDRERSTTALCNLILRFVELRRNAVVPSTDSIDLLIAEGTSDRTIVGTILGIIFAGVVNTGMISCWTLLHLGSNATWKERAINEYKSLVENYTNTLSSDPLHKRLAIIPLSAWEDTLPSLDLIIREVLRLTMNGSALRRNLHHEIVVDEVVIRPGEFLTYQMADVHMNPEIYTEPTRFDPERYVEGREEDRKQAFAYIGWGVGRHPCAGMRMAKLEIKLVLALILLGMEYEVVDGSGKYPDALPVPDRNDIQQARPVGETCYLKFKRVLE